MSPRANLAPTLFKLVRPIKEFFYKLGQPTTKVAQTYIKLLTNICSTKFLKITDSKAF